MKKILSIFITFFIIIFVIILLSINTNGTNINGVNEKIQIVATLFPQYDFVRQIGGDKVDVTLLLPPGTETHTYEPLPKDIIRINESDLFVYTGNYMEPWAESISESLDENFNIIDVSEGIEHIKEEHEYQEHVLNVQGHEHKKDPHIWLDISNAKVMVDNITKALVEIDVENTAYYVQNAKEYKEKLDELDNRFETVIDNSKRNLICFGDKFSYMYFVTRYNLDYITLYDSCLAEAEPSLSKQIEIIERIERENLPVIFYESLSNGTIAKQIAQDKGIKALVFSSVHTISSRDIQNGATYISVMDQNLENLKIALN